MPLRSEAILSRSDRSIWQDRFPSAGAGPLTLLGMTSEITSRTFQAVKNSPSLRTAVPSSVATLLGLEVGGPLTPAKCRGSSPPRSGADSESR